MSFGQSQARKTPKIDDAVHLLPSSAAVRTKLAMTTDMNAPRRLSRDDDRKRK